MKTKFSRRNFLKLSLAGLGTAYLAACGRLVPPSPTALPTLPVIPSDTFTPQPTSTSTPEPMDITIYKNSFEGITDLAANGITSTNNDLRINTENVDYQSGSQSLEAYGTIAGPIYSTLTIEFSVKKLTGEDALDLSNKTVGFSFFVPADSPITSLNLDAFVGTKMVVLAVFYNYTPGKWLYQQADLKTVYENNAWSWTDLSNDEAREVVSHCQEIMITGMRTSDGAATPTSFLIDDFKWIGINDPNHIALDDSVDSIRKFANLNHMKIGSPVLYSPSQHWFEDPWYLQTLAQEFNITVLGSDSDYPQSATDNFDYNYYDQLFNFAEGNGLALRGITGGWHLLNPQWLMDADYNTLKNFLDRREEQDVGRYKGKVLFWDVFNEVVDDAGDGFRNKQKKNAGNPPPDSFAPYGYHYSPWVDGNDTSLIEEAFIKARAVDPDAKLFLNDFQNEEIGKEKSKFFYDFVTGMKNRGIPIDGVGFELHQIYPSLPWTPALEDLDGYLDRVDQNIKRYAAAGLLVEFTEVECQIRLDDINLTTQAGKAEHARRVQKQADILSGLMRLAKENANVAAFFFWAVSDKLPGTSAYSTSNEFYKFTYTDAYLFDKNHYPKPAYYAVLDILKT
jgi:endo-1,4-beta-xylanase